MKESLIDVTKYFLSKSKPGIGSIFYENGLDMKAHKIEIDTAHWILETFGGKITVLKEKNLYLISNPDYEWNDKYWELKNPSKKTINKNDT